VNSLRVDLVKRNYWPQINFVLNGAYSHNDFYGPSVQPGANPFVPLNTPGGTLIGSEQFGWSALITLDINIWDWGTRKNNVEIAINTQEQQDDALKDTLNSTNSDLKKTILELNELQKSYDLQKELLNLETQSYILVQKDYREGKIPYLDLITNLNDLLDTKVSYYTIYYQLMGDVAKFHFFEGNLYEEVVRR